MAASFLKLRGVATVSVIVVASVLLGAAPAVTEQIVSGRTEGPALEPSRPGLSRPAVQARNPSPSAVVEQSAARQWNETLLNAIRGDFPKPPVHARNLFHVSVAMWDAWAAYDPIAVGYLYGQKHTATDVEAARAEAISFAAYRLLKHRFPAGYLDADGRPCHPNGVLAQAAFDARMDALGYDKTFTSTTGDSPAALGNRIGAMVIAYGQSDGANEGEGRCYPDDTGYASVNPEMVFQFPGAGDIVDPNRWQPLAFEYLVTQNGIIIGAAIQKFIGVGWLDVLPFALAPEDTNPVTGLYIDPGPPPLLGGVGDDVVKAAMVQDILFSSQTDPTQGHFIDISPAVHGNNPLGTDSGTGYGVNPVTGEPYPPNVVNLADYVRVVAEFWADGPRSETPPGHWNVLANYVADHPAIQGNKRIGGRGVVVNDLEWDVKVYLALNGAVHDSAIACWGGKNYYDSSRPITLIRYMGGLGQSSDPSGPSYHPDGLPLVPGLIEVITLETTQPGQRHAHLAGHEGEIAIRAWKGSPADPHTQIGGVDWMRAVVWMPYQARTFVTPPFPGYTSGHSTYSRSAAEVLTAITGSPYFPGGLGTFTAPGNEYLSFELGPTNSVTLQWTSYYDSADEAGISRRFGGIHPSYDDYPSRIMGSTIGHKAWDKALEFFSPQRATICHRPPGNPANSHTITIGASAVPAHMAHGDAPGPCPATSEGAAHAAGNGRSGR